MPISNRDNERMARSLAKSQSTLDDIDNLLDNKPFPRDEELEARLTKQWGPDPDPVDPDNPTIFRFQQETDLRNPGGMRIPEAMGRTSGEYVLENNDRNDRIDMFGSTNFTAYRRNELFVDEDGPLHGVARPIYKETHQPQWNAGSPFPNASQRDHMYMSREDKQQYRDAHKLNQNNQINAYPHLRIISSNGPRTNPARSRTLNRNPTGSQRLPIRQAAQRAIEGNHARAGGRGTGDFSFRTRPGIDSFGELDAVAGDQLNNSSPNHVIYSYRTPIAWSEGEGANRIWTVPHKKHSRTTSRHQSAIHSALWNRGYVPEAQETPGVTIYRRADEDGPPE